MKRSPGAYIALCGVALLIGLTAAAIGLNAGEPAKTVRIIYTNDTLGNAEPCG